MEAVFWLMRTMVPMRSPSVERHSRQLVVAMKAEKRVVALLPELLQ